MRPLPQHDRAALVTDAAELRRCAARLQALTAQLPAQADGDAQAGGGEDGPDWPGILAALTERCLAAAADLDHAASLYADAAGPGDDAGGAAPGAGLSLGSSLSSSLAWIVDGAGAALGSARRAWPGRAADRDALVREGPVEL